MPDEEETPPDWGLPLPVLYAVWAFTFVILIATLAIVSAYI